MPRQLWDFSLALYRQPGVEHLCLTLQDQWRADINILLWLRWLEIQSLPIDITHIHQAETRIATWNKDAVWPLRKLRTEIKQRYGVSDAAIEKTRTTIKSAELLAERVVQGHLHDLAQTWFTNTLRPPVAPGHNLTLYARHLHLPVDLCEEMLALMGTLDAP